MWCLGRGGFLFFLHNPFGFSLRVESTGSICHCLHHSKSWLHGGIIYTFNTFYFISLCLSSQKVYGVPWGRRMTLICRDGVKCRRAKCKLKMHEMPLCLLQICVLLFTCLYIVCYLILTHFKKTAEFVTGEFVIYSIFSLFIYSIEFCLDVMFRQLRV